MEAIRRFNPDVVYFDDTVLPFWPYDEEVGLKYCRGGSGTNQRQELRVALCC
jgi:alpha-L-fucosidase